MVTDKHGPGVMLYRRVLPQTGSLLAVLLDALDDGEVTTVDPWQIVMRHRDWVSGNTHPRCKTFWVMWTSDRPAPTPGRVQDVTLLPEFVLQGTIPQQGTEPVDPSVTVRGDSLEDVLEEYNKLLAG